MPYKVIKRGNSYMVVNADTGAVHAKHTTKAKADAQVRLLRGVDHGFKPSGQPAHTVKKDGVQYNVYTHGGKRGSK